MKRRNTLTTLALLAAVSCLASTTGPTAYADKKEGGDSNCIDDDDNEKKDDGDDEESSSGKGKGIGFGAEDEGEADGDENPNIRARRGGGQRGEGGAGQQSLISRILIELTNWRIFLLMIIDHFFGLLGCFPFDDSVVICPT